MWNSGVPINAEWLHVKCKDLINAKFTAPAAIKTIQEAYPADIFMQDLAKRLKEDRKNGTLPDSLKL